MIYNFDIIRNNNYIHIFGLDEEKGFGRLSLVLFEDEFDRKF